MPCPQRKILRTMDIRYLKCGAGTGSERAIMGTSLKKVAKKTKEYKYVLLAMRHAKTEPFGGNGSDVGRELTDKGRKQAKAVAKGLAASKWCPLASHAPAPPAPVRPAIACSRCSATIRKSTTGKACTKAACNPCSTSSRKPRKSIARCSCLATNRPFRSPANGWPAPNPIRRCLTC